METRLIIAYSLIAIMVLAVVAAYFVLTREQRSSRRSYKRSEALRRKRQAELPR